MANFEAYDAGAPCKNPSCKSNGRPHPNCKCYSDMAEGGEVSHFCSQNKSHEHGCEYYADGGTVDEPLHPDPSQAVAAFLGNKGLHGLLKMGDGNNALEDYNNTVQRGHKHFEKKIDLLFQGTPFEPQDHGKSRKAIDDWVSKGGATNDLQEELYNQNAPVGFAEGGEAMPKASKILHDHPVALAYPEQNIMLQAAKGRMSNYLSGLKPQENAPKLAFDRKPDDRQQKKAYQKALHIAAHPLSVLEDMQKGTLGPEQINHLKNLHPEVDDMLQKKLTERVTKDQLENKRPKHKIRQGLSLLLGAPLSSDMTSQNMQAIQATFHAKQQSQQEQAPMGNKKNTSALTKVDDSYLTSNQSRVSRSQKQ